MPVLHVQPFAFSPCLCLFPFPEPETRNLKPETHGAVKVSCGKLPRLHMRAPDTLLHVFSRLAHPALAGQA